MNPLYYMNTDPRANRPIFTDVGKNIVSHSGADSFPRDLLSDFNSVRSLRLQTDPGYDSMGSSMLADSRLDRSALSSQSRISGYRSPQNYGSHRLKLPSLDRSDRPSIMRGGMSIIDEEPIAPRSMHPHSVKHVRSLSNKYHKVQEKNDLFPQIAKIDHLIEKVISKVADREDKKKSRKMEEIYELEIQRKKLEIEELKTELKMKKEGKYSVHEADPLPITTLMKHYVQTVNPFTYQVDMPPIMYPQYNYPYPYPYSPFANPPYPYPYAYPPQPYPQPYPYPQPRPPREHKKKHKKKKYDNGTPDNGIVIDDAALGTPKGILKGPDSKGSVLIPSIQKAGTIKTLKDFDKQDSIKTIHETLRQQNEQVYPRKEMEKTFVYLGEYFKAVMTGIEKKLKDDAKNKESYDPKDIANSKKEKPFAAFQNIIDAIYNSLVAAIEKYTFDEKYMKFLSLMFSERLYVGDLFSLFELRRLKFTDQGNIDDVTREQAEMVSGYFTVVVGFIFKFLLRGIAFPCKMEDPVLYRNIQIISSVIYLQYHALYSDKCPVQNHNPLDLNYPPISKLSYVEGNGFFFEEYRDDNPEKPDDGDGNGINDILEYDDIAALLEEENQEWDTKMKAKLQVVGEKLFVKAMEFAENQYKL